MKQLPQLETLNNSESLFPFPPHRRRHLKSETFNTLVRILSHCYGESKQSHPHEVVSEEPKRGSCENELGQETESEVLGEPVDPTCMDSEIFTTQRDSQSSKVLHIEECFNEDIMEIEKLDHVNRIENELFQENGIKVGNKLEDKNPSGNVVTLIDIQERQCSLEDICMEESGKSGEGVVHEEHYNCNDTEGLDLSIFDYESPMLDESNVEGCFFVERNELEEVGNVMPLIELEKSVSSCGIANSSLCVSADNEIEEGEIPGNFGLCEQSTDFVIEDTILEERKVDEEQTFVAITNEEQLICKEHKVAITNEEQLIGNDHKVANQVDTRANKNSNETVDGVGTRVELILKESKFLGMEHKCEMVDSGERATPKMALGNTSVLETGINERQDTRSVEEINHSAVPRRMLGEDATDNQGSIFAEKDTGVCRKKKRGPLTEGKREKKKRKRRIERAEKNRLLGVKRLKIQPVLKPKTVTYCRHYLNGRCQEGEKCKFSHDTIPLTKSKPCSYFARHQCMKGDGCPYDHQLSKYPCDNYLSTGFCRRGTECMFSHEMPHAEGSPSTTNVSKPQLEFSPLNRGTSSKKQLNASSSSHQKVDSNAAFIVKPSCKNSEQKVAETILKPKPKGISKLLFGTSSLGNPTQHSKAGSSRKADAADASVKGLATHSTSDMDKNSTEMTRMTAAVGSKGINSSVYGKAPSHDSNIKKPFSLPFSNDCGILKSTFAYSGKDKQAGLSPKKDCVLKVGNQTGQSSSDMVHNSTEMPKITPVVPPRGINFLSFGKAPLGDSSNTNLASIAAIGKNDDVSSVQERENAPKLQIPGTNPWRLLPSSLPSDQSMDRLADKHGKDAPSLSLKALLSNTSTSAQKARVSNLPNSAQKSLMSTLAFAAKYESKIKMDQPAFSTEFTKESSSSQNTSRGSTILDFLYAAGSKNKQ